MADLNMKFCGKCFFHPPCLLCVSAEKDICKPERVYRMRIDPKYPLRRGPNRKIDTRGEDVNFAKRLGGEPDLLNDDSEPKLKLSICPRLRKHFKKELPSITSNWSKQKGNREETKDYYRSS